MNNILIPYPFNKSEKSLIAIHSKTHDDWTKTTFDAIKSNIISHLRLQQSNLCCYCKYPLGFDIKQVDIEHIVPKSQYPKFSFHCKNLALSCPACNTKKSTKSVLNKAITNYPRNGSNFKIVHAHFDDYSTHIDIFDNCVFIAKTTKGSETITCCELFRLSTVEQRVKAFKVPEESLVQRLIVELTDEGSNALDSLISIIRPLLK
ncbi:HNH endonuclease [Sphingobacterium sp. SG20118]|uniref:HNH endonuclease n=1 Tax=Sphingobacterium sp. SG20118 TaxID=3367156 RepID=UPI0037DFC768